MIKKLIFFVSCAFFASFAQAQTSLDKVVAVVGNEAILQSDIEIIYLQMKASGELPEGDAKCQILQMLMDQKLLLAQAKLDSLNVDLNNIASQVDRKIATYSAQFGGAKNVEDYFQKSMEKIREEMVEINTEQAYAQRMRQELVSKVKVTPNEVEKFFKTIPKDSLPKIPDQYQIYQIVKRPNSEAATIEVKEQLLDLRKRILEGEKFQSLASLYSEDPGSARRGGEVGLSPLEGYVAPVRNAIKSMRPGQVSQIIESEYGFHILQLIEKQPEHNLVNYRHILIRPKYTADDRALGFARLDSITRMIKADSITFENAALYFSDDEKSRAGSGLLFNISNYGEISPYFYKDQLNPTDYRAMEHLSIGEISEPFESVDVMGNAVYKVIVLKKFIPSHSANLTDDYGQLYEVYKNKKENDAVASWVKKKGKTEYIRVNEQYRHCSFVEPTWGF